MKIFELRFLDKLEIATLVRGYKARDDLDALEEAKRLCKTHAIEVWHGDRRVARINKGNMPLATAARQSL